MTAPTVIASKPASTGTSSAPCDDPTLEPYVNDVPDELQGLFRELVAQTDQFCRDFPNEAFRKLCRDLALELCQEDTPARGDNAQSWASGIAYTADWVNAREDQGHATKKRSTDMASWFGVATTTMHSKSKIIRDGLIFGLSADGDSLESDGYVIMHARVQA